MREELALMYHLNKIQHFSIVSVYFMHVCAVRVVVLEHGAPGV